MRNMLIVLGLCAVVVLAATLLTFRSHAEESPEDAEARRIIESCAIGGSDSAKTALVLALAPRLRELNANASISSQHVGAIVDTIKDDGNGVELYKNYTTCIKTQTILSLQARKIRIEPSPPEKRAQAISPSAAGNSDVPAPNDYVPARETVTCTGNTTSGSSSPVICGAHDVTINSH